MLGRVASQFACESEGDPDETSRPEESTEPVDPAGRLFPRPHDKAEREGPTAGVVGGSVRDGSDAPPGERQEQRRVRELSDGKAARPSLLAAPPEFDNGHRTMLARL
jgi:hypothetical protein